MQFVQKCLKLLYVIQVQNQCQHWKAQNYSDLNDGWIEFIK